MSADAAPSGFYAVCSTGRAGGYFWAAWWTSSGLATSPKPDAHGLTERVEDAHAQARAAILKAKGAQAKVLRLDADLALEAARVVLPRVDWRERERREEQANHGWRRPAPAPRAWLGVLGLTWPCTAAEVRKAYRRLALQHHPDRGGSVEGFTRITDARDAALREI